MSSSTAAWRRVEAREALLLALFAGLMVLARGGLHWHLHIPGHAMFATALFLILARGCVPRAGAASAAGLAAGLGWAALGAGRGGPLVGLDLILPAIAVDVGAALPVRGLPASLRWAVVGALAGAVGFFPAAGRELVMGAPGALLAQQPFLAAAAKACFGALGGGMAAAILGRLRALGGGRGEAQAPPWRPR